MFFIQYEEPNFIVFSTVFLQYTFTLISLTSIQDRIGDRSDIDHMHEAGRQAPRAVDGGRPQRSHRECR